MCPLFVLSIDAVLWLDAPCSDRANHTVPKFYPSNIVTSRSLISTMECLPRRFYGGITRSISRWNNFFADAVQHGNHVIIPAGGCQDAAAFCAKSFLSGVCSSLCFSELKVLCNCCVHANDVAFGWWGGTSVRITRHTVGRVCLQFNFAVVGWRF